MRTTLVPLAVLLAIAVPAAADECVPKTSTSDEDTTVIDLPSCGATGLWDCYLAVDHPGSCGDLGAVWLYGEFNGIPGLQRHDDCVDDTCGGQAHADTLLSP